MFDFLKKFVSYGKIEDYPVKLVDEFVFHVPKDYIHSKQIQSFKEYAFKNNISCSDAFSNDIFTHASYELEAGEQYYSRLFRVGKHHSHYEHPDNPNSHLYIKTINTYDLVSFINGQNRVYTNSHFVGAQGLSFIWQFIDKEKLKEGSPILGIDKIDVIRTNRDRVPAFSCKIYGKERVVVPGAFTGEVTGVWDPGIYLVQVSKITDITRQHYTKNNIKIFTENNIPVIENDDTPVESESADIIDLVTESSDEFDIDKIENADISLAYEFLDDGVDISDYLDKFTGEKSSKLALKIIEADSEFGAFNVANNIKHFDKLNKKVAEKLIENDEAYCVEQNLDKFEQLDQKLAELLIENDAGDAVLENINKFFVKDESRIALKIIDNSSSLGAFIVMQSLDKFTTLSQLIAVKLIENDEAYGVLNNISKFSVTNESQLALKIMEYDSDGVGLIFDNFDKFKDLNKRVVSEIVKNESLLGGILTLSEEFHSHIGSFTKDTQDFIKETYQLD